MGRSGLIAALLALLAAQIGCKEEPPPANLIQPERPFLYEAEFAQTPTLAARQHQVVVFDLEPTGAAQATAENISRHELEAGVYSFCIEKDDPYLQHLSLEDAEGHRVVALGASAECVQASLAAGTYRLRLVHDGRSIIGTHRLGFLHRMNPRASLLGAASSVPRTGLWAMAPDDPTGKLRQGRLHALPPPQNFDPEYYAAVEPIVADFSSRAIDDTALFDLTHLGGTGLPEDIPSILSDDLPLDLTVLAPQASSLFVANASGNTISNKFQIDALEIVDLGNQKVQLQATSFFGGSSSFFIDSDGTVKWSAKPANIPYMNALVLFQFYDPNFYPGPYQGPPAQGEVVLFQGCNYTGKATVFVVDTPDLSALTSSTVTLDRTTASVKLGPDTAVLLHSDAGYGGTGATIEVDTACLDGTPIGRNTRSLQVRPLLPIFIASSSCEGCNLTGVDLTGVSVSGADLRNANLSGATLNKTSLRNARSLAGTSFNGATITCSDFSGSEGQLVDLTQTDLSSATFSTDISTCRSNFSNTKVDDAHVAPAVLRLLDLTHSTIALGSTPPTFDASMALWPGATVVGGTYLDVDFSGANLAGSNFSHNAFINSCGSPPAPCTRTFQGANLDGIVGLNVTDGGTQDLSGVIFTGATLRCLPGDGGTNQCVDLGGTNLTGAHFENANLTGANLTGALQGTHFEGAVLDGVTGLQGADLRGSFLTGATASGVNLTGAKLDGSHLQDAGFQGATLIDVSGFQTAISNGADFSGAHLGGTGLVQAFLEEVTLDGATFQAGTDLSGIRFNDSSLKGVDLSGLKLFGANFTQANLEGASLAGASLSNNPGGNPPILDHADFTGAHLKNVNLSSAQLQGTVFHFASFYGSFNLIANGPPVFPCETDTSKCGSTPVTGFTCSCASAVGANMTRTDFTNAFLYGVDFRGNTTVINGVDFSGAILVGANFENAKFEVDPAQGGAQPKFPGAFLQGTNLSTAALDTTSFLNAYLDFEPAGNQMQVVLGADYTSWNGWEAPGQSVCVQLDYSSFVTQVPVTTGNTECPDGLQFPGGCGATPPRPNGNPNWNSTIAIDQAHPPGYYRYNATYTDANQSGTCNYNTANLDW